VRDTLLRVDRHLGSIAHPSRYRSWLVAIAFNAARDLLRRRKRLRAREEAGSVHLEGTPDSAPDPAAALAQKESLERLRSRLERMPEKQRAVFALIVEGLPVPEIAARLELSEPAVWSRIRRGRDYLRSHGWGGGTR